ncbi:hypothetical protein [Streptomyces coeruleorubidus]|uniref:hypothetical protein n=1 Tax=Streptomyces coeruleorubidus TaxID=116188 RepID=UPI0033B53E3D
MTVLLACLAACIAVAAIAFALIVRPGDDQRTRNDRVAAQRILRVNPPTEQHAPGSDHDLLLDAHLAYGTTPATRKETP